jgi:pimeloyl-ACP methyl ester carboxylesterase
MSIEQYKELAQQEETYPAGTISKLKHYLSILTSWGHTPLEQLLVEDDVTFKSKLTSEYEQFLILEDIGNIHCLNVPHPLGSEGADDIPLVVFIHGLGGNFQQFDYQIEYVSKFAQVVALDLPGSGSSTYVKGFQLTLENFSDCVEQLLKHFQVHDKKLILVGHSYGTQVCIKLVNSLPRVETVVFLAPPRVGFKRTWFQSSMLRLFLRVPWLFNLFRKLDRVNNIHSHSLKRLFAPDSEISDFNKFKQFKFNISTNSKNVLTHALSWKPLELEEILEMYSELSTNQKQIVVLDGSQDKVTRDGGSTYRDFLGSQVHYVSLDKTGHNMMLEHPDEINQVMTHVFATCDHRLSREYVDDTLHDFKK